jgi:hypothetical protein
MILFYKKSYTRTNVRRSIPDPPNIKYLLDEGGHHKCFLKQIPDFLVTIFILVLLSLLIGGCQPVHERRRVIVEYPPQMRVGDTEVIRVIFRGDAPSTAYFLSEHVTDVTPMDFYLDYDAFDIFVIAYADSAGLGLDSIKESRLSYPDETLSWTWTMQAPNSPGRHRVALRLLLRAEPHLEGDIIEHVFWEKVLTIDVKTVFGLTPQQAAVLGQIGAFLGPVLTAPYLYGKWQERRAKKKESKTDKFRFE